MNTLLTAQELQERVLQLTKWSEEQYSYFMYESGLSYLRAYFGIEEETIGFVSARKEFWNWFRLHWYSRDQAFVESFSCKFHKLHYIVFMYESLHNPVILAHEIFPSRQVLGENFPTIKPPLTC